MILCRQKLVASAALASFAVGGCQEAQQPAPAATLRLPAQICNQARQSLEEISRSGSFEFTSDGQATLEEAVWLPMGGQQRDALAQALALHAACSAKEPPREQQVTIKNEGGRVLTQRVVETSVDITKALQQ